MGMAASQARFLNLTARKSNTEYQGQQVNQARSVLAQESANIVAQMSALEVPTPPIKTDYSKMAYTFTDANGKDAIITDWSSYNNSNSWYNVTVSQEKQQNGSDKYQTVEHDIIAKLSKNNTGRLTQITIGSSTNKAGLQVGTYDLGVTKITDDDGYESAWNQYLYDKNLYDKEVEKLNAKTAEIQAQDKTLELQLKQLDTEQEALTQEMEAVKAVIQKNVEKTFNTFA